MYNLRMYVTYIINICNLTSQVYKFFCLFSCLTASNYFCSHVLSPTCFNNRNFKAVFLTNYI